MAATRYTTLAGLTSVGFQSFTALASAVGFNSTIRTASVLDISVETVNVRFRADGTDPTNDTGVLLTTGYYRLQGYNGTSDLKFIPITANTATIQVQGYKHAGE